MEKARVHAVPVVEDEGVILGMISQTDLFRESSKQAPDEEGFGGFPSDSSGVLVEDVMSMNVVKLPESASLSEAARLFANRRVHRIPIVSRDDVVVGILSVMDLVRWIASQPRPGGSEQPALSASAVFQRTADAIEK